MNVIIRTANTNDLRKIQELNNKLFELEFNNFDSSLKVGWPFTEKGESYFKDMIENEIVFVAIDNSNIIGYLAGTIATHNSVRLNPISELDNCYVEEEYRRYGIGTLLLNKFKEYCSNKGIEEMKVTASALNVNAIDFYKKNGFTDFEVTLKTKI